jgi:uncharacterized protein (DUF488 family)
MLATIGYERRDLEELLELLRHHAIDTLVDVRGTPRSRKPGFSKSRLAAALVRAGIEYRHEGRLGVEPDDRPSFRAGDPATLADYREGLEQETALLSELATLAVRSNVALLCFERAEHLCHRQLVTEAVLEIDATVEHLAIEEGASPSP